ncbi:MAG: RecA-family ATPase [Oleiphilaceae bacterium]|jgi:RecA-family ATPase
MGFVFNIQEYAEKRAQEEALAVQTLENTKIPVPQTALAPLQMAVGDFPSVQIKQQGSTFIPINAGTMTDSSEVEARPFLVQDLLLLGYLSLLVAPGGVGKSVFAILVAITVATGRDFCGLGLKNRARVLLINNEDDQSELHRRISALCQFFGICREELDDWLYVYSGYEYKIMMAQEEDGIVNKSQAFYELQEFVKTKDIKLVIFDPFVSTHTSNENDNNKMDMVMSVYKEFVSSTKASGLIVRVRR